MTRKLRLTKFKELSLADPFFNSLKAGYKEFPAWFKSKANEDVYVVDDGSRLSGMIYLKIERGRVTDVKPPLPNAKWLKVGTLKIEGRGTKLGERVLKKVFDTAIADGANGIYVTVFEMHKKLIDLFKKYGFEESGKKTTKNGTELVLVKRLDKVHNQLILDYPRFQTRGKRSWLLAVYPEYHSKLLPDSILNNEPREIVQDVSHTNTIHKVYIGGVPLTRMGKGDIVVLYRTSDGRAPARFRSVVTSVCVVEDIQKKGDFANVSAFLTYCAPHSVFSEKELRDRYSSGKRLYVAKMTYNAAFGRRITRGTLLDDVGVSENPRWDLRELTGAQLRRILRLGRVNACLVIN